MPEEFEGQDLSDAVFWGVDLSRATFRDVNLSGVSISHAVLEGVTIDGLVDRLVVNGIDVTDVVNAGDRWYPLRTMVRPATPADAVAAWDALDAAWADAIERARRLPDGARHAKVDGEFSFVETLRHLVFGADKWFTLPILGATGMHPMGLANTGSLGLDWPGVDRAAAPSFDEAVAVRAAQVARIRTRLATLTTDELDQPIEVIENGTETVRAGVWTILEESFEHLRYALRDLATLE